MNFNAIDIKFVLVGFGISKFMLMEFSICPTQLKSFSPKWILDRLKVVEDRIKCNLIKGQLLV